MPVELVHHVRQFRRLPSLADRKSQGRRGAQLQRRPLGRRRACVARPVQAHAPSFSRRPIEARPLPGPASLGSHPCVARLNWHRSLGRALMAALVAIVFWGNDPGQVAPVKPATAPAALPADTTAAAEDSAPGEAMAARLGAPAEVWLAIAHATREVGVDTAYMTAVAARESSFNPTIRAVGTTATGLYQFTADTWLRAVKMFGARHGLGEFARQIAIDDYGNLHVGSRAKLLQLRNDPELSALMAAELARDNKARLERLLGRDVTPAETYLAHFLGVGQAARIIAAAQTRPHVSAAHILPAAARSNPAVFTPAGHAVTVAAMVGKIEAYFEREVPATARI
jgi:transglycosylase-like protein with SLT domain